MNICLLTNQDLASNIALNYLLPELTEHKVVVFYSGQVGSNHTNLPNALQTLKFFEQTLFNEILFTQLDNSPTKQTEKTTNQLFTFKQLAQRHTLQFKQLNHINQIAGLQKLESQNPDLILSIRFGKILQQPAIDCARHGVLNLHSGLLPQYQGVMATFWAMLNNETHYGTSLHWIETKAIDAGAILKNQRMPLDLSKSYLENLLALYQSGCSNMLEAVKKLHRGEKLIATSQTGTANYYTFPREKELKSFVHKGLRLVDYSHITQISQRFKSGE